MATQKELLYKVLDAHETAQIKAGAERKDFKRSMSDVEQCVKSIRKEVAEVSELITDPNEGLIVSTNKNTEWRKRMTAEFKLMQSERTEQARILDELGRWKSVIDKAMWILFTSVVGILLAMVLLP